MSSLIEMATADGSCSLKASWSPQATVSVTASRTKPPIEMCSACSEPASHRCPGCASPMISKNSATARTSPLRGVITIERCAVLSGTSSIASTQSAPTVFGPGVAVSEVNGDRDDGGGTDVEGAVGSDASADRAEVKRDGSFGGAWLAWMLLDGCRLGDPMCARSIQLSKRNMAVFLGRLTP